MKKYVLRLSLLIGSVCSFLTLSTQHLLAQTPYFEHAIAALGGITFNGTTRVDSFDSSDPTASFQGYYYSPLSRANASVASGGGNLALGNAQIAGYVSSTVNWAVVLGLAGSVGDLSYLAQGNLGIQEGHHLVIPHLLTRQVQAPFSTGMTPESGVFTSLLISSNFQTFTTNRYVPPENTSSVTTNLMEVVSSTYPEENTYVGTVTSNSMFVTSSYYPDGYVGDVTTNLITTTNLTYPAEGTYVGEVETIKSVEGGKYFYYVYQRIVGYTYLTVFYSFTATHYDFTFAVFTTNQVSGTFDHILRNGHYVLSNLSGKLVVAGNASLLVSGNINITGLGRIQLEEGSSLQLFCAGETAALGNFFINNTRKAENFRYWGLPSNTYLRIPPDAVTGCFYAPQADAVFGSGGAGVNEFVGSVVAKTVTTFGHFAFHYDEALKHGPAWESPLYIYGQPQNKMVGSNTVTSLSAAFFGSGPVALRWWKDGLPLTNDTAGIQRVNTASLLLNGSDPQIAGDYFLVLSNSFGPVTSRVATVTFVPPPTILSFSADAILRVGDSFQLEVSASGVGPLRYQWQHNGTDLAGATNAALSLENVQILHEGSYRCIVSNGVGTNTTRSATLTVQEPGAGFPSGAGVYNGLFAEQNNLSHHSAGFFTLNVRTNGRFSGKLMLDGDVVRKSGIFNSNGLALVTFSRAHLGKTPLSVQFQLDFRDRVIGTVTHSHWQAELTGFTSLISTNPVPEVDGRYTFLLPSLAPSVSSPSGTGYALLNVRRAKIAASGYLPDGQVLKQSIRYSEAGHWPFYARHYLSTNLVTTTTGEKLIKSFSGSTIGWLTLSNRIPTGTLHWQMPADANQFYPAGLTNSTEVIGSEFLRPVQSRVMNVTNGLIMLSDGILSQPFTNGFFLKTNNAVLMSSTNKTVRLVFSTTTGSFSGSFVEDGNRVVFRGAILQNRDYAAGYFSPTNGSGNVVIAPADPGN